MPWWQLTLAALLLMPGWAKGMAMFLNWLHGWPWPAWFLFASRLGNDLLVFGIPVLWAWGSYGHTWSELMACPLWGGMSALGVLGWFPLGRDAWRYLTAKSPSWELACTTNTLTWPADHPARIIAKAPGHRLAYIPGNEQFSLAVRQRTWEMPHWPADAAPLTITHLSDCHFRGAVTKAWFEEVCQAAADLRSDMVCFTGDLLDDDCLLEWVPATFGRLSAPLGCYFLMGNHDWYLNTAASRAALERLGWQDLSSRTVVLHDQSRKILLAGTEAPWMGQHPVQQPDTSADLRLLLSHTPDNFPWAVQNRFEIMLAGHTHGGQIRLPILGPVYSPSRYGVRYSAGVFDVQGLKMHVSAGVSGREPLRINCPPEVTQLRLIPRQQEK